MNKVVKCVVWDLDDTLWAGVLMENDAVTVHPAAREAVLEIDRRGILQSIASRNDFDTAMERLEAEGLAEYFLYPQISWSDKADAITRIAKRLNISLDTLLFVDDQPFERDAVRSSHPEIRCADAADVGELLARPDLRPQFATDDSSMRRKTYIDEMRRQATEAEFVGTRVDFLRTLEMRCTIAYASETDLERAAELTVRTNQLNTTGRTYSLDELRALIEDPDVDVLICRLDDRYGSYGRVGLAIVHRAGQTWRIKLLLTSCRVMARNLGTTMLIYIQQQAKSAGVRLLADFVPSDRNRQMLITYRFAGFETLHGTAESRVLEHPLVDVPDFPEYVDVTVSAGLGSPDGTSKTAE